jgi:membrane protein required for beta-lactamase induction
LPLTVINTIIVRVVRSSRHLQVKHERFIFWLLWFGMMETVPELVKDTGSMGFLAG